MSLYLFDIFHWILLITFQDFSGAQGPGRAQAPKDVKILENDRQNPMKNNKKDMKIHTKVMKNLMKFQDHLENFQD